MIKYECDACKRNFNSGEINVVNLPRNTLYYAKDSHGAVITCFYGGIKIKPTHLCNECLKLVANLFPRVEADE